MTQQTTVATLTETLNAAQAELDAINASLASKIVKLELFKRGVLKNTDKDSLVAMCNALKVEFVGKVNVRTEKGATTLRAANKNFSVQVLQQGIIDAKEKEVGLTSAYARIEEIETTIADLQDAIANADRLELFDRLLGDTMNDSVFAICEHVRLLLIDQHLDVEADAFPTIIMHDSFRNKQALLNFIYDYLVMIDEKAASQPEPVATGKSKK